jgi:hypothetical protein
VRGAGEDDRLRADAIRLLHIFPRDWRNYFVRVASLMKRLSTGNSKYGGLHPPYACYALPGRDLRPLDRASFAGAPCGDPEIAAPPHATQFIDLAPPSGHQHIRTAQSPEQRLGAGPDGTAPPHQFWANRVVIPDGATSPIDLAVHRRRPVIGSVCVTVQPAVSGWRRLVE